MEHSYYAELDTLYIRPLAEKDLEYLRSWRNDKQISRFFRKIDYITSVQQQHWYRHYLEQPNIYYWTILERKKAIGSLAIYDVKDTEGEIGKFMIGNPMSRGKGYGYKAFIMALKLGFQKLQLEEIRVTVHEMNIPAKKIYERIGFEVIGRHSFNEEGDELEMFIKKEKYMDNNPISELIRLSDSGWVLPDK